MDTKENNMNPFGKYSQIEYASPVLKILWMMLFLAIRDKCKVITFSRKRGKRRMAAKLDNEHNILPPPRHLFSRIISMLRRIGRDTAKNPQSPFWFTYIETGQERKFDWFVNHSAQCDINAELNAFGQKIYDVEESKRKLENEIRNRQIRRKRLLVASIFVLVAVIIAAISFLTFF